MRTVASWQCPADQRRRSGTAPEQRLRSSSKNKKIKRKKIEKTRARPYRFIYTRFFHTYKIVTSVLAPLSKLLCVSTWVFVEINFFFFLHIYVCIFKFLDVCHHIPALSFSKFDWCNSRFRMWHCDEVCKTPVASPSLLHRRLVWLRCSTRTSSSFLSMLTTTPRNTTSFWRNLPTSRREKEKNVSVAPLRSAQAWGNARLRVSIDLLH